MTDIKALREAVAETIPYCGQGETVPNAWARRGRAERKLLDAIPALLDELEAARAVLDSAALTGDTSWDHPPDPRVVVTLDKAKWLAWREAKHES